MADRLDNLRETCEAIGGRPFTIKPIDDEDVGSFLCAEKGTDDPKKDMHFEVTEEGKFRTACDQAPSMSQPRDPISNEDI